MTPSLTSAYNCPSCQKPLRKQQTAMGNVLLWCPCGPCKSTIANDGYCAATEADAFEGLKSNIEEETKGDEGE